MGVCNHMYACHSTDDTAIVAIVCCVRLCIIVCLCVIVCVCVVVCDSVYVCVLMKPIKPGCAMSRQESSCTKVRASAVCNSVSR